jgi:hypothetical protein
MRVSAEGCIMPRGEPIRTSVSAAAVSVGVASTWCVTVLLVDDAAAGCAASYAVQDLAYRLMAVVVHEGEMLGSGRFICYVRAKHGWHRIDNEKVGVSVSVSVSVSVRCDRVCALARVPCWLQVTNADVETVRSAEAYMVQIACVFTCTVLLS